MTVPNALIVGVNKAGTTAVFSALARHKAVCASSTKETHFFDPLKYGEPLPPIDEYEAFFDRRPGQYVVLEATPGYFYGGRLMAETIREASPNCKIVVVLREPSGRAFSWYRYCRARLMLPQDLDFSSYIDRCIELGLTPETSRDLTGWRGLSGGLYARWLPEWRDVFGDDLMVVFHDDLEGDFAGTLEAIGIHFGLDVAHLPTTRDNVSVDIRRMWLQRMALRANTVGERLWRRFPGLKHRLRSRYYRVNSRPEQTRFLDADRDRLMSFFAASVADLKSQLGHVPPSWERSL